MLILSIQISLVFCALAFYFYGFNCLFSDFLKSEFKRFGLAQYRLLTGALQLLGATGLLAGLYFPLIGVLAAAGLSLLMLMGFITRLKIKDSFKETFPSFLFMLINLGIALGLQAVNF